MLDFLFLGLEFRNWESSGIDLGNFKLISFMKLIILNIWQFIYKINYM